MFGIIKGLKAVGTSLSNPKVAKKFGAKPVSFNRNLSIKKKPKKKAVSSTTPMVSSSSSSSRGFTRKAMVDRSSVGLRI